MKIWRWVFHPQSIKPIVFISELCNTLFDAFKWQTWQSVLVLLYITFTWCSFVTVVTFVVWSHTLVATGGYIMVTRSFLLTSLLSSKSSLESSVCFSLSWLPAVVTYCLKNSKLRIRQAKLFDNHDVGSLFDFCGLLAWLYCNHLALRKIIK